MQIDVLTLFPEFFQSPLNTSILKRAQDSKKVNINTINIRDYSTDRHKKTDDRPFGGGCGMVMSAQPIFDCIENLKLKPDTKVIMLCPTGEKFTQNKAIELSQEENLVFLCGHYEGIDERVRQNIVTDEISIGDYILTGGEIATLTVIDSIIRLLPDVLGNDDSALQDSFSDGLLDCPHYTRPSSYKGFDVPEELISGNHKKIEEWRFKEKLKITLLKRPDLFKAYNFENADYKILEQVKEEIKELIDNNDLLFLNQIINANKKIKKKNIYLDDLNWNKQTKANLEKLIKNHSHENKIVVFDFDNTIISRDIGEYSFSHLVKNELINIKKIQDISPDFNIDNQLISLDNSSPIEYYESLMKSTAHQSKDQSEIINGYIWLVQALTGLSLKDIVISAKTSFSYIEESEKKFITTEKYLPPFFQPEMIDLIGKLIISGFKVNIVSASNVWLIRFIVKEFLNPLLEQKFKKDIKVLAKNIFGINTLLKDKRDNQLYKDIHLIKSNKNYLNCDLNELDNYQITNQIVQPVSTFEGKTTTIKKYILKDNQKVFLTVGDSPNDLDMMINSEYKLWIERTEKSSYLKEINDYIDPSWYFQKVNTIENPGFIDT